MYYAKWGQELFQSTAGSLLQSRVIVITVTNKYLKVGQLYYKMEELLQSRAVHLHDTWTNGDSFLLIGLMQFESGVV